MLGCVAHLFDPEIPVNIYELGLVYEMNAVDGRRRDDSNDAHVAALSGGAVLTCGN